MIQDKTMVNTLKCTSEIVFKFNCKDVVETTRVIEFEYYVFFHSWSIPALQP